MGGLSTTAMWLRIPLALPPLPEEPPCQSITDNDGDEAGAAGCAATEDGQTDDPPISGRAADPWEWWNLLRTLCGSNAKLGVLLEVQTPPGLQRPKRKKKKYLRPCPKFCLAVLVTLEKGGFFFFLGGGGARHR
jgi:hypothetical protein